MGESMKHLLVVILMSFSLLGFCSCKAEYNSEMASDGEVVSQGSDSEDLSETDPDTQNTENANEEKIFIKDFDGIVMAIKTDKSAYSAGESIYVTASLENARDEEIYLWYSETQNYDVDLKVDIEHLFDSSSEPYDWGDDVALLIPFEPGEKHVQHYTYLQYTGAVLAYSEEEGRDLRYPDPDKAAEPGVYSGKFCVAISKGAHSDVTRYTLDFYVTLK